MTNSAEGTVSAPSITMNKQAKIFIAGHRGMVGSALVRKLTAAGFTNLVVRTRAELDLVDQAAVQAFMQQERPAFVFLAAARVGGILANSSCPAEFIYQNIMIESNLIHSALQVGVERLLFLGSSCIYPKFAPQPMTEDTLLTGLLEPTNEPYAIAKIAGIKLCEAYHRQYGVRYFSAMPTNLYGPNDNFDLKSSHVLPALLRKFHEAKKSGASMVEVWGSGRPRREFLYVDDAASACLHLMQLSDADLDEAFFQPNGTSLVNVGCGEDVAIGELAELIGSVVGFDGKIVYDADKPDGTPRKLLDVSKLRTLGWQASIGLCEGIEATYRWYLDQIA